jgi:GT2 family glycosyltransferase
LKWKDVEYLDTGGNLGFGKGHNYVMDRLDSKYHAIVNPDILLTEDSLGKLIAYMDEEDVGMVVPKLVDESGEMIKAYRRELTVWDMFIRFCCPGMFKKRKSYHTMDEMDYTKAFHVPFAQGSFLIVRTDLYRKLEGFDDRFFMYLEDADLCKRANEISAVWYYPDTTVIHKWEKGSHKSSRLLKIHLQSMYRYFKKWGWK